MKQVLEWANLVPSDLETLSGRWLWVGDGTLGYAAPLADLAISEALDDFAAGYDGPLSDVTWELWEDGESVDGGTHHYDD